MTTEHTHYEIFISYARQDNRPIPPTYPLGWVTAIRDHILADHRRFSTEPLRIFFDQTEIRDMDDWRHRILGALRHSKILLVCLSPNYFASRYCRWEWDEYVRRQVHQLMGSESIATVYFVEVPGSREQDNARWLDAVTHGNFTDIRPWFPEGAEALQKEEVRTRMAKLGESLWERIQRARRAEGVPGNLRRQNPYFVGRDEELRKLHEQLATGAVGLVTAVHGLGGQGKTELAVAYAHNWADWYPAGLWVLGAEGKKELLPLIGELANAPELGYKRTEAERNDPALLGRAVLAELKRRCVGVQPSGCSESNAKDGQAKACTPTGAVLAELNRRAVGVQPSGCSESNAKDGQAEPSLTRRPDSSGQPCTPTGAALLILDNVSEASLLSPPQLATLPANADWLRIIATTRLGRDPLRASEKSLAFVAVDSLADDDALALVRDHQEPRDYHGRLRRDVPNADPKDFTPQFSSTAEETAAREIVRELGGFTLAVEQVAVQLGLHPEIAPSAFLAGLRRKGLPSVDELGQHADVREQMLHQQKQLAVILDATLALLDEPALTALHFAALLPPDTVPWPWLKALTVARHPALAEFAPDESDPWLTVRRRLEGFRLLTPGDHPELARLHRLVAAHLTGGPRSVVAESFTTALESHLAARANAISDAQMLPDLWELDVLLIVLPEFISLSRPTGEGRGEGRDLVNAAVFFSDKVLTYRSLREAFGLLRLAHEYLGRTAAADPGNAEWQRDLSVSYEKIGDVQRAQGDLAGALASYRQDLAIAERLARQDPGNAEWQRDLVVSYWRMADMAERNNTGDAARWWRKAYEQLAGMKQRGIMLPTDEQYLEQLRRKIED